MTLKELLSKLNDLPPEHEVLCYCEDEIRSSASPVFDVIGVTPMEVESSRGDDEVVRLRFGKSEVSRPVVLIEITADL